MTLSELTINYLGVIEGSDNVDGLIKMAEADGVSENDARVMHNLVYGNVYTQENLIKVAEDQEPSAFLEAVSAYERYYGEEDFTEADALEMVKEAGLEELDLQIISGLLDKQAEEAEEAMGISATDEVWEKVAEAHEYLSESGLDPVTSMEFAEEYSSAEDEDAQDKVASDFDGLDEESIDKIAEAFEYLSDIEGQSLTSLMAEFDKEAGKMEAAKKAVGEGFGKAKGAVKKLYGDVTGKNLSAAEANAKKGFFGKKKKLEAVAQAKKDTKNARIGAGIAGGTLAVGGTAAALNKQASEEVSATDEVWDKVAEAYDFLDEAGLDAVNAIEFAENFASAEDEEAQDKVASEFDGLDEESIDKIAEAFEYLSDIEGASLTDLMLEVEKEAGKIDTAKKAFGKAKEAVKSGAKTYAKNVSGKGVAEAEKGVAKASKKIFGKKKAVSKAKGKLQSAKKSRNVSRAATVAGGLGLAGAGAAGMASFQGRG